MTARGLPDVMDYADRKRHQQSRTVSRGFGIASGAREWTVDDDEAVQASAARSKVKPKAKKGKARTKAKPAPMFVHRHDPLSELIDLRSGAFT